MKTQQNLSKLSSQIDGLMSRNRPLFREEGKSLFLELSRERKPDLNAPSIRPFVSVMLARYNSLIAEVANLTNAENHLQQGAVEKADTEQKTAKAMKRVDSLRSRNSTLRSQCSGKFIIGTLGLFFLGIALSILLLKGEWTLLSESFQLIASSKANAINMAVASGIGLLLLTHIVPVFIDNWFKHSRVGRRFCRFLVCFFVSGALFYLSFIRADYLNKLNGTDLSVWPYFVWTYIPFIGMFMCAEYLILPRLHAIQDAIETFTKQAAIGANTIRIWFISSKSESRNNETTTILKERLEEINFLKRARYTIEKYYQEDLAEMISVNLRNRTDGVIPKCFSDELPPLDDPFKDLNINQ